MHRTQFRGNASQKNEQARMLQQHHLDIQRIWKRLGQAPQEALGENPWADPPFLISGGGGSGSTIVSGVADDFYSSTDVTGTFTTADGPIVAVIPRGLCLDGKSYQIATIDDHNEVLNPELTFVGKPTALVQYGSTATVTVWGGTKGSEATTSHTVSGYVRNGLVFSGLMFQWTWVDTGWEVADPATEFVGISTEPIEIGGSGTIEIDIGTLGSESGSATSADYINSYGEIASEKRVRVAWSKWGPGWEVTNSLC